MKTEVINQSDLRHEHTVTAQSGSGSRLMSGRSAAKSGTHEQYAELGHPVPPHGLVLWSQLKMEFPFHHTSNVINDPCFHTFCTAVDPRLTPPIYVQHELSAKGNNCAFNDVFALHHDETPSRVEGLTSTTVTESAALDKDIFCPYPDDEQPGI